MATLSAYDALVRMAQNFSMRYQLVDGQGNFGSVDGVTPAAYRYTECRMTSLAAEPLADIDPRDGDFVDNYDGKEQEPVVLPTRVPNLLVNGSAGIAVGMATNIPPHNLGEVVSACIALIDDPTLSIAALMQHIPGPDFPTAGIITARRKSPRRISPVAAAWTCVRAPPSKKTTRAGRPSSSRSCRSR